MTKTIIKPNQLTVRQSTYLQAYTDPASPTFGNAYRSAVTAGYSNQTARNFMHLKPSWLSENIGKLAVVSPDEIMLQLTAIINNSNEPTIVRLKAIEMTMKAYNMLIQHQDDTPKTVTLHLDLTGGLVNQ